MSRERTNLCKGSKGNNGIKRVELWQGRGGKNGGGSKRGKIKLKTF